MLKRNLIAGWALLPAAVCAQLASFDAMPELPQPYELRDWKQVARDFDTRVFDPESQGQHLPLMWWDDRKMVNDLTGFAIPSYVGDSRQHVKSQEHEAIASMASVLGATLAGIDKSDQHGRNYVAMLPIHYHQKDGIGLYLNNVHAVGSSYWYDLLPSLLFYQIASHYPDTPGFDQQVRKTAEVWREVLVKLGGANPDFEHTGFNFIKKQAVMQAWKEPDAAAAIACIEYLAYQQTGDAAFLEAANWALQWLDQRTENPFYECLLPYGAYTAARSNAEQKTTYDTAKLMEWVLAGGNPRKWGAPKKAWHGTEVYGLIGSVYKKYEYAFAMNSFHAVGIMTPIARYDERYALPIAKWVLNVAVNARLFYPNAWPAEQQSSYAWAKLYDPKFSIPYEGLRKQGTVRNYVAQEKMKHGTQQEVDQDGRIKRMSLIADEQGRIHYQCMIEVPVGAEHRLIVKGNKVGDLGGRDAQLSTAPKKGGPYTPLLVLNGKPERRLQNKPIAPNAQLWVRIDAEGLTPGTGIRIGDLLVETRFKHPPHVGGDPTVYGWGETDLGLYGGAFVGFLAGLFEPTNVEGILAIDLVATDVHAAESYPTYLLFNPHAETKTVSLPSGELPVDLYDTLTDRFVVKEVAKSVSVVIEAKQAVQLVFCPAGGELRIEDRNLTCNGVVIDYGN